VTTVVGAAPAAPPEAAAVFGPRLEQARRYAELLAGIGIERGLLGPREADRVWDRHLLNCALAARVLAPEASVADIGSGAGLPGIPLALADPSLRMTLVEPMARRAQFLSEVVEALDRPLTVLRARAEELPPGSYDAVTARAVAPLARLATWALPLLRPGGVLVALKGATAEAEIREALPVLSTWGAQARVERHAEGTVTMSCVVVDLPSAPRHRRGRPR
jgi:16S rRNA (guanine527-N7)-methyltransferase